MSGKVVGLAVSVLVIAGGWWAVNNVTSQDHFSIAVAFGIPHDGAIEMNALASLAMAKLEPPRVDPVTFEVYWQEWADQHFDLRDASGTPVKVAFRRGTERSMIPPAKIRGAPVGYLLAKLRQGTDYTFDYVPKVKEPTRYRHTFTAPTNDTPVSRLRFEVP